ncbi:MAG: glycosyltransferase family 2 protein [Chthoniobacteraceae bacterium]
MKVSIVTPCFNAAATIEETIRSVLDQEGIDLEYIVCDGGSTDGTADIIRRHESRLAWWVSERDRGQVDAINKGFTHATGDVLGFLNGDDVLVPGALQKVCAAFAKEPEVELVQGGIEWIDFEGRAIGTHLGDIRCLEDALDVFRVWWGGRQWVQPEVFYRRALKEHVGPFNERYHLAFDYDFWVRCFRAGARVMRVPETFVRFRRHDGQKSVDATRANGEIRAILAENLADCPQISPRTRRRLRTELAYDIYQSASERPSFLSALLRNPSWLLCAPVRQRIAASLTRR